VEKLEYKALVSGVIFNDGLEQDVEIFNRIDNDLRRTEIFIDLPNGLLDQIDITNKEHHFLALVEAGFSESCDTYDVDILYNVKELKTFNDLLDIKQLEG